MDKQVQYLEVHSQTRIKSSLPYDFPLGFYREGTILPVFVERRVTASQVGLLRAQIYWPWALPCNFRAPPCKRRHCPWPGFTGATGVFTGSSPVYSRGAPTVYSPRSSPAWSHGTPPAQQRQAARERRNCPEPKRQVHARARQLLVGHGLPGAVRCRCCAWLARLSGCRRGLARC